MRVKLGNCSEFVAGDGTYLREILNNNTKGTECKINYSLAWFKVLPLQKTKKHSLKTSEVYYILSGNGEMHIGEESFKVKKNDTIYIPPNAIQWIENISNSEELIALAIVNEGWESENESIFEELRNQTKKEIEIARKEVKKGKGLTTKELISSIEGSD